MIGSRLKAERDRLGFTQEAFAEIAGSKRRSLIDWEKGVSSPTAAQMAALASAGLDAQFVVTGIRQSEGERSAPRLMAAIKAMAEKMPIGVLTDHQRAYLQNILSAAESRNSEEVVRLIQELPSSDEAELLALYRAAPLAAKMAAVNALQSGVGAANKSGMTVTLGGDNRGAVAEKIVNKKKVSFGKN